MKIADVRTLLKWHFPDVPDHLTDVELDLDDGERDIDLSEIASLAPAVAHQALVSIAAITGLRVVLEDRIFELFDKHDTLADLERDIVFVTYEIVEDLLRALVGSSLGKECEKHELEKFTVIEALREDNDQ